jgi:PHP family Zn ribbon phosphoesterase
MIIFHAKHSVKEIIDEQINEPDERCKYSRQMPLKHSIYFS